MFFKVHIKRHERGLWFRHGDFHKLLRPGTHYNWGVLWNAARDHVQVADTLKTRFTHEQLEPLARRPELRDRGRLAGQTAGRPGLPSRQRADTG